MTQVVHSRLGSALVAACAFTPAFGELPRGYRLVQLTSGPEYDNSVAINNHSQIVFARRMLWADVTTEELFLYDGRTGELTQLTDDNVRDTLPDINDAGVIAWERGIGHPDPDGPTSEIMIRQPNGQTTRLTYDSLDDRAPSLNEQGHIAWNKRIQQGCSNSASNIWFYDGQMIRAITTGSDWSDQSAEINDFDEIVWTRYDFCPSPWESRILLYSEGSITELTDDSVREPVGPTINNVGQIAWQFADEDSGPKAIHLWENGDYRLFTDWGMNPRLNSRGDMFFIRWYQSNQTYQAWLYLGGEFFQLSNDPFWNTDGDINESREVAWKSRRSPDADIRYLERLATGDLNCDGSVNPFDIEPFVLALTDPNGYAKVHTQCDLLLADGNGDGSVNQFDIQPFLELLGG